MKKIDLIVISSILFIAALLYFSGILKPTEIGGYATIYVDGTKKESFSLSQDGIYTFTTSDGYNVLEIKDGKVTMIEADCRDQICVHHTPVSLVKESITCLPHKLIIEIEGTKESEIDGIVQ